LKDEDYENLDSLDKLIRQQTAKRDQLMHTVLETIPQQLQAEWKAVVDKTRQVASCASAAAQAYQVYKVRVDPRWTLCTNHQCWFSG
jgi:hypothetical protein